VILELKLAPIEGVKVFADEARIFQVLTNLLSNAVKVTKKGAITVETQTLGDDRIAVGVSDTGRAFQRRHSRGYSPSLPPRRSRNQ
jgi:signal transduction histidine kinase